MTRTAMTFAPPVMEARRWLDGVTFPPDRPLINVSQAAPVESPPPLGLRQALADAALNDPQCAPLRPGSGASGTAGRDSRAQWTADLWRGHRSARTGGDHAGLQPGLYCTR